METTNEKYQVIVSSEAAQQLVSHAAFLANVSADAAERLVQSFEEAAASLRSTPLRCPYLRGSFIPASTYRFLSFEKRYLFCFRSGISVCMWIMWLTAVRIISGCLLRAERARLSFFFQSCILRRPMAFFF